MGIASQALAGDPPVDLILAIRTLHELSKKDGDLGYAYWNSVIELLRSAGQMQSEIAELRRRLNAL